MTVARRKGVTPRNQSGRVRLRQVRQGFPEEVRFQLRARRGTGVKGKGKGKGKHSRENTSCKDPMTMVKRKLVYYSSGKENEKEYGSSTDRDHILEDLVGWLQ